MTPLTLDGVPLHCLAFDFDGVLCDSARECFRNAADIAGADAETMRLEAAFLRSRWLVRPPWHFGVLLSLLQRLADEGVRDPDAMAEAARLRFPRAIETWTGDPEAYEAAFFANRSRERDRSPEAWFGLNVAFSPAVTLLKRYREEASVAIVSTKDEAAIGAWLSHAGVALPTEKIFGAGAVREHGKAGVLERIARDGGWAAGEVGFIDDNLDNLLPPLALGFPCWLAEWGYVIPETERAKHVRRLTLPSIARWLGGNEGNA